MLRLLLLSLVATTASAFAPSRRRLVARTRAPRSSRLRPLAAGGDDGWGDDAADAPPAFDPDAPPKPFFEDAPANPDEPERDMFVPAVAIFSTLFFFGTYAYETLRLIEAGEFYMPKLPGF